MWREISSNTSYSCNETMAALGLICFFFLFYRIWRRGHAKCHPKLARERSLNAFHHQLQPAFQQILCYSHSQHGPQSTVYVIRMIRTVARKQYHHSHIIRLTHYYYQFITIIKGDRSCSAFVRFILLFVIFFFVEWRHNLI